MSDDLTRRVGYRLADDTWIVVPILPLLHSQIEIPGHVIKPDGTVVYIEDVPADAKTRS